MKEYNYYNVDQPTDSALKECVPSFHPALADPFKHIHKPYNSAAEDSSFRAPYPQSAYLSCDYMNGDGGLPVVEAYSDQLPEEFLNSKIKVCKDLACRVLCLLGEREDSKLQGNYQIELDILKCHNQLLEIERFYPGQNKTADQKRLSTEQRLFDLYHEKRAEESSCWRDQLWLKKDLLLLLREYLEIQRRKELLEGIFKDDYSTNPK